MPNWVTEAQAIHLNKALVDKTGEPHKLIDRNKLASALDRPQNTEAYSSVTVDVFDLAAEYVYGIANNHPFINGNKRTAYAVGAAFLRMNGYRPKGRHDAAADVVIGLVNKTATTKDMATFFRQACDPRT
jgi:death on curing protein